MAQVWPSPVVDSDPQYVEIGQHLVEFGRELVEVGPHSAEIDQSRPDSAKFVQMLALNWPNMTGHGPNLAEVGWVWSNVAQIGRSRPNVAQNCPTAAQTWPDLGQIRPESEHVLSTSAQI